MTSAGTSPESTFETIERLSAQFRRSGPVVEKLWRQRSVELLTELFFVTCDRVDVRQLLECGAHAAEASVRFVENQSGRRAIALEANPYTFEKHTRAAQRPNLIVLAEGVGEQPGSLVFQIPTTNQQLTPVNASFKPLLSPDRRSSAEIDVPMTTLDQLMERFGVRDRVALWIDVEGYAKEVLNGGKQLLESVEVAMIEVESECLWVGGALEPEITDLLSSFGLHPIARDCQQDEQFNIIYSRGVPDAAMQSLVHRFLGELGKPVAFADQFQHAARSGRKQGYHRALYRLAKRSAYRLLGPTLARTLKRVFVPGGRRPRLG
jgi:FkbM family methyltransferase